MAMITMRKQDSIIQFSLTNSHYAVVPWFSFITINICIWRNKNKLILKYKHMY